jgi:glyoxylase-like metal-dependent hydrolase (beta-lactamase superfamily II)
MLTRRAFLASGLALPLAPRLVRALPLGPATLTTVSDGSLVLPGSFIFAPVAEADLAPIVAEFGLDRERLTPECNLALYRDGTNTVLFDIGSGPDFMPTAGKLAEGLDAAGVAPEEITHVVFTHAHPDHIWGLLDEFDEPVFPDATYMMGRAEWDYWWNPATVDEIGEARAPFAVGAKRRMEAIEGTVEFFDDGEEILPGIAALASYGHTPGHMSFEVRNGSDAALIAGDTIGNHHIAFVRPELWTGADQDEEMAAQTRLRLFDRLANEQMALIGFHLPEGGIGRAVPAPDGGFRFVPEDA